MRSRIKLSLKIFVRLLFLLYSAPLCALVLATSNAIMTAIGNATKHGFLVREGDVLERLACVKHIAFDKTGTLTFGTPEVIAVNTVSAITSEAELYQYVAAVERLSEHSLGKAVIRNYIKASADPIPETIDFHMTPGKGNYIKAPYTECKGKLPSVR